MSLAELLARYGYLALFAGCLLEGETLLVLAGIAAQRGLLWLPAVIGIAAVGGTLGDQVLFWIGRRYGDKVLRRWPRLVHAAEKVERLIERYPAGSIVGVRFMYGLRLIGPVVIGMSNVSARRFVIYNVIGASIWAVVISTGGYYFGHALQWVLATLQRYEEASLAVIVIVLLAVTIWAWLRRDRPD